MSNYKLRTVQAPDEGETIDVEAPEGYRYVSHCEKPPHHVVVMFVPADEAAEDVTVEGDINVQTAEVEK